MDKNKHICKNQVKELTTEWKIWKKERNVIYEDSSTYLVLSQLREMTACCHTHSRILPFLKTHDCIEDTSF